jgi:hypothetical protein
VKADALRRKPAESVVNCKQIDYLALVRLALAVFFLFGAVVSAFAQRSAAPALESWRPADGYYESPGKDFDSDCRKEYGVFTIELAENSVSGLEWHCEINKITDTAPGAIRLNMTCYDINMPTSKRDPYANERPSKEIMLLERLNEKSMTVRKTLNGKFKGPSWQADYCPEDVQRAYIEEKKRVEEEARYKVPEQLLNPKQWRPKDGIYASPGADFGDRCMKSGDVVVGLSEGSISSGKVECKVVGVMSTGQTAVSLTCSPAEAGKQALSSKKKGGGANARKDPETSSADIIRMSRIDDNTFHMQKTVDQKFKDDGGPVAYCPEDAQLAHAARVTKK